MFILINEKVMTEVRKSVWWFVSVDSPFLISLILNPKSCHGGLHDGGLTAREAHKRTFINQRLIHDFILVLWEHSISIWNSGASAVRAMSFFSRDFLNFQMSKASEVGC